MSNHPKTVTIIGAGVIGSSWAAAFAAKGCKVRINDVRDDFEQLISGDLKQMLGQITDDVATAFSHISFHASLGEALEGADLVQENGPENPDFKQTMFADIESQVSNETLIVSSSSGIPPTVIGEKMKDPNRAMIGHPFNPPHLIPLVEVCATPDADDQRVNRLVEFYEAAGKVAVRLNKPIAGFVANRLQTALVYEAINIVKQDVVDIADLDKIMLNSLGIRWASIGPLLTGQLGAGDAGLRAMIEKILSSLIAGMGYEAIDEATLQKLDQQSRDCYPLDQLEQFEQVRDARQQAIIEIQQQKPLP